MGSQTETILRRKMAAHARARLFSVHAQDRLSRAINAECAAIARFFNTHLKDEKPDPTVEPFAMSLPALSIFPAHFRVTMPATEGDPESDILVSLDLPMVNIVSAYRISGTLDAPNEAPSETIGTVEKRLAGKFATSLAEAFREAINDHESDGARDGQSDGKPATDAQTTLSPTVATPINDLATAPFNRDPSLFIRLSFSPRTVDDQALGTFCITVPAALISGDEAGDTTTRKPGRSFDQLADAISIDVRSIIAELTLPLDKLLALEPQSILPLNGASINELTLRPVRDPATCIAKGSLGSCDGARAISISPD